MLEFLIFTSILLTPFVVSTFILLKSADEFLLCCEKLSLKLKFKFRKALEGTVGEKLHLKSLSSGAILLSLAAATLGFLWTPELVEALWILLIAPLEIYLVLSYIVMALYSLRISINLFPLLLDQLEQKNKPYFEEKKQPNMLILTASLPLTAVTFAVPAGVLVTLLSHTLLRL